MLQKLKLISAMLLVVAFVVNCPKEKDDDDNTITALLLFLNDQQSGNCATATRGTPYSVSLSVIPKGACSLTPTREATLNAFRSQLPRQIAVYERAGSDCDTNKASVQNILTNLETLITTTDAQAAADAATKRVFVVGSLLTEAAKTLENGGYNLASTRLGSVDDLFLNSAHTAANTACKAAIRANAANAAVIDGIANKSIVVSSTCQYGTSANANQQCASLREQF